MTPCSLLRLETSSNKVTKASQRVTDTSVHCGGKPHVKAQLGAFTRAETGPAGLQMLCPQPCGGRRKRRCADGRGGGRPHSGLSLSREGLTER